MNKREENFGLSELKYQFLLLNITYETIRPFVQDGVNVNFMETLQLTSLNN